MDVNNTVVNLIKRHNLSDQVFSELIKIIADNKLKSGDSLPTESELIQRFGVSRSVVRESMQRLHMMGVIETKTRVGATLCDVNFGTFLKHIASFLINDPVKIHEIEQFRYFIEPGAMELVVKNITDEEIKFLEDVVIKMENSTDYKEYCELESIFHSRLCKASKNRMLSDFSDVLFELFHINEIENFRTGEPIEQNSTRGHAMILEAVKSKDGRKARELMEEHLKSYL